MVAEQIRKRIACYAAVITIILQQLNVQSVAAPSETPTPLVRIRHSFSDELTWHPDELVTDGSGTRSVLVWAPGDGASDHPSAGAIFSN